MKRIFKTVIICSFLTIAGLSVVLGQPGDPGGDPDNPIPITGIEILIAAGAFFGIKYLRDKRKSG